MTDTIVALGDFEFSSFEVPEEIPFGGAQSLTVHKLVGGARVVDAMGVDPAPLEWSGYFIGSTALDRALYLDELRKAGKPLSLTWSRLSYTVTIRELHCTFQRFYRLPYRIVCEVVADLTTPVTDLPNPPPNDQIYDDLLAATMLLDDIGDDTLSGLMSTLSAAINAVGTLTTAVAPSTISSLLVPLTAAQTYVAAMITTTDASIASVATTAGSGNAASMLISTLSTQITALDQQPSLILLNRTLGRMGANLASINSGTHSVTVAGGNLMSIAAGEYGDAMGWTAIALANGLTDPEIAGIATLSVPQFINDTGGVLNA